MTTEPVSLPKPVREFPHRACFWSGLLGLAIGAFWCVTGIGPYRWLADWQMANWNVHFPPATAVVVLLLTLLLFLFVAYCLFTYVFGSLRYEVSLPFTIQTFPGREIT